MIMERKIGEIFKYNGEWYQCLPEICICNDCAFKNDITCKTSKEIRGECQRASRQDGVIFKKLEKVGEPYDDCGTILQRFKIYINVTNADTKGLELHIYSNDTIGIEIKQNKEEMKDKKLNLKPFDIQKARTGKPVCTRDGRKARIICFDRRLFYKNVSYPILALVECSDGEDDVCGYNEKGKVLIEDGAEYKDDLMMLPEKKEGWVNVYKDGLLGTRAYNTKKEAFDNASPSDYVDTVMISWEE